MTGNEKVILDAGHGGDEPGAIYNGRKEKDDTLRLTLAVGRNGRDDAQTQFTRSFALQFGDRLADIVVGPQRFPGAIQHHFAGLGRDHGFLRTVEQHDAQLLFERLHLHAQRRLGHETMLCGQRKTTAVRHRQEVFKLNYSHSSRLFQYTKI